MVSPKRKGLLGKFAQVFPLPTSFEKIRRRCGWRAICALRFASLARMSRARLTSGAALVCKLPVVAPPSYFFISVGLRSPSASALESSGTGPFSPRILYSQRSWCLRCAERGFSAVVTSEDLRLLARSLFFLLFLRQRQRRTHTAHRFLCTSRNLTSSLLYFLPHFSHAKASTACAAQSGSFSTCALQLDSRTMNG